MNETPTSEKMMRILVIEPGRHPEERTIPHTLEAMQAVVGGYIQATYPWDDPCALVCDEEGLLKEYPLNRQIDEQMIIAGTFFICGLDEDNFADLSEKLMEKYKKLFWHPEVFFRTKDGVKGLPVYEMPMRDEQEEKRYD